MSKKPKSRENLGKKTYNKVLAKLQADLVNLQGWIVEKGLRAVVIFEGRRLSGTSRDT